MRQVFRRVWYAIRQRRFEADLAEELEFHRAMKQRELEEGGLEPTEATFATRRALGSSALAQDHSRDVWCPLWLQGIGQDFLLVVRTLLASRIVSTVAVLSLALGIGANTAIFSVVNSLLLRTLPVREPEQLALLSSGSGPRIAYWNYGVWDQLRQRPRLFDGAVAWSVTRFDLSSGGETQFVDGLWANGTFFDVLGVPPWLGRTFSTADDRPGGGSNGPVAVISYGFWQRHFDGAREAIGRTLTLDRVTFTIVGVTPPDFFGADVGRTFDVAVPLGDEPLIDGSQSWLSRNNVTRLTVMARLKPGQTLEAVTAALRGVQPHIRDATLPEIWPTQFLGQYLKEAFTLVPAATGTSNLRRQYERPLVTIVVVVALVLLIACANVANLLLARATARRHEFSVRRALGASPWRLMRQLLIESAVLAGASTVVGLFIASWGSRLLVRQLSTQNVDAGPNPTTNTVFLDLSLDWRVLAFTIGVTVATALLFGLAPALRVSRVAPMDALKEHGRGTAGDARVGLASGLVVVQVALSLMLVVAAGLFARTFASLTARHLGFDRDGVLLVTIDTGRVNVDPTRRAALYQRAREAVLAVPGVAHAAVSTVPPMVIGPMIRFPIQEVSGGPPLPPNGRVSSLNLVSPGWFETFGIPFVAGRDITDRDRLGTPPVVVVNEAFASVFLNGASPIGHTITLSTAFLPGQAPPPIEIVGVVADALYARSLRDPISPTIYLPFAQRDGAWSPLLASMNLSVRSTGGSPALLTKSVAAAIGAVNPELALTFRPLASQIDASLTQDRVLAMLSGFFGALALLLAGLGLYGVTSYGVSRRRREIGVHIALGAAPGHVQRLVLSRVSVLVVRITLCCDASLWP
jgi:putative ABC transport system permease protein